jgi:DNA-binding beta-propeller fold protein YncE
VKGHPASLHARENGRLRERLTGVYDSGNSKVLRSISPGILAPQAMAFDASGDLYVSNPGNDTVMAYAPGGSTLMRTISKDLDGPQGIAFDSSGNLYVALQVQLRAHRLQR